MFKKIMKNHHITPLEEIRRTAMGLGVKLMPCQMSMDLMEIRAEDLIEGVENPAVSPRCWKEPTTRSKHSLFKA